MRSPNPNTNMREIAFSPSNAVLFLLLRVRNDTLVDIGSYRVRVLTQDSGEQEAVICPATVDDMPTNWTFYWQELWRRTDFEFQNIVKLVYNEQIWGLIRYSLYLYPYLPETLEIDQIEANPTSRGQASNRLLEPIGKWLIWYATQVGLRNFSVEVSDTLIFVVSLDSASDYYRDIIEMEYAGATTIAPGEDGYVFRFSTDNAAAFCRRHETQWGIPKPVNP